ncbi:DUF4188 domain-containing protein [Rubrivirga marina]|uniref:Transcriptional regulator n=1 Tax=Rubrivirga marina TaxID=1196024 RepID=A0A271IWT4_9BACT|nr:DUF4188 domain-containing protein [Rubrivirga marina]PAP75686.1 transcriptional regulator [Rubrivirga marina]
MPYPDRTAAHTEGDVVVFLIGTRINKLHRPDKWVPVVRAMGRAMAELSAHPELGLLGSRFRRAGRCVDAVQYWRSFDHLHAYARARDAAHLPAWQAYNRAARGNDAVGVWHETFLVRAGEYEAVYRNMPTYGLAKAAEAVPAVGAWEGTAGRLGRGVEPLAGS